MAAAVCVTALALPAFGAGVTQARPATQGITAEEVGRRLDVAWVLTMTLPVYLMHGGFGFFEAGMTRRKSTVTTLTHNLMVLAVTVVVFWAVGFGVMFGDGPAWAGMHGFAPSLLLGSDSGFSMLAGRSVPLLVFFAFTLSYADTPATLVVGTCAERLKLSGFVVITAVIGGLMLPLLGRWEVGGGFLAGRTPAVFDTGSGFLQLCGGCCALATAVVLGPRQGRFGPGGEIRAIPSSSMPLVFLGAFVLWMGFLSFNAGFAMTAGRSVGLVLANTVIGSMAGACVALMGVWLFQGKGSLRAAIVGMLTGCVAVTSPAAVVEPWAAAGFVTPFSIALWPRLGIDDATEYLTMNVVGGLLGQLCVGLLASPAVLRAYGETGVAAGLFYGGGGGQLWSQAVGVGVVAGVSLIGAGAMAIALRHMGMLRVGAEEEAVGSDIYTHGEAAYADFAHDDEGEGTPKDGHGSRR